MKIKQIKQAQQVQPHKFIVKHVRHKSQSSAKANPWQMIGRALTQRYNRKFLEAETEKEAHTKNEGMKLIQLKQDHQTPRFQIKRKYLSLNPDVKSKILKSSTEKMDNRTTLTYFARHRGKNSNEIAAASFEENDIQQSGDGYNIREGRVSSQFVPNFMPQSTLNYKYKAIYIKKNLRKVAINPQLRISVKKKELKEEQKHVEMRGRRGRHPDYLRLSTEFQEKDQMKDRQTKKQSTKMFRPWSGYQSDETL